MKFDQLRYFLQTAKEQHIGRAARTVAISPSAVHHAISSLEEELGVQLFQKHGRSIQLTDAGRRLEEHAERLLSEVELIREDISQKQPRLRGHMRMVASHVLSRKLMAPVSAALAGKHPDLRIEVITLRSAEVLKHLLNGEADLGICFAPQPDPRLKIQLLYETDLAIYVRSDHPILCVAKKDRFKKLSAYPAIMPKAFAGIEVCATHPMIMERGLEPKPSLLFDSYEVATEFLLASDGWSLIPEWVVQENGKARDRLVKLSNSRPSDPANKTGICAVYRNDRMLSASEHEFLAEIKRYRDQKKVGLKTP